MKEGASEGTSMALSTSPLLKQAQLEKVVQEHVWLGFKCLHRWRHHKFFGQLVPIFSTLRAKIFFSCFRWNLTCINLYPLPLSN